MAPMNQVCIGSDQMNLDLFWNLSQDFGDERWLEMEKGVGSR
jgi:hypothetical protein